MSVGCVGKIYDHFENVTDPRVNRGTNYLLMEMVLVALCGAICDCNSWVDVAALGRAKLGWFRKFLPFEHPKLRQCRKAEQNRHRHETRPVAALPVPKDSAVFARRAGLATIGSIDRTREIDGRWEASPEFFLTSLPCQVREIARQLRSHGSIENSQHHVLEVIFTADASRIRKGNGPEIRSVFRRLALHILQQDTSLTASIRSKRKLCGWSEPACEQRIAGFSGD